MKDYSVGDRKVKGINKNFVKKMKREEYKDVLFSKKCVRHGMKRIQSKDHKQGKYTINKIFLSCFDD